MMVKLLKKTLISLVLLLNFYSVNSLASDLIQKPQPQVTFTLIKNEDDGQSFSANVLIQNLVALPHPGEWELAFNISRPLLSAENATVIQPKQGGDFYLLKFNSASNQNILIKLKGEWFVKKYTDAPSGYFLTEEQTAALNHPAHIIPVSFTTQLPSWTPPPGEDEASRNKKKMQTSIEGNPTDTVLTSDTSLIVPLPVELRRNPGEFVLNAQTKILYADNDELKAAAFFASAIQPATGFSLESIQSNVRTPIPNSILLTRDGADVLDATQRQEGYILEVTPSYVIIRALSPSGFFYGLQSIRQLLPPQIYSKLKQPINRWAIPGVYIRDYPRFGYRGLQIDSARHFIPASQVKRLLDLMAIHKLNYFQWHLTDDEGWRIEIKKYPQLTAKGGFRGFDPTINNDRNLLPAYGSGAKSYGGFYTQEDIRDIVRYAEDRHITIVPEIDMPGHARAMVMSLPQELIDETDTSQYTSIQGYHDNVLSPCKSSTYTVIDDILTEVAQLFPGKYIHVGGDEVPTGVWEKSCMANKYNPKDPLFRDNVQNEFMKRVQDIITSKGKIMAGWEEVAKDTSTLSSPLRVYIWNSSKIDQAYQKSAQSNYEVIMSVAENLYFDLAYGADPKEPGQYWAGYVDTFSPYSFTPIDNTKGQTDVVIKGVQGQLWSEKIDSLERLDYLAFPKVAGLAELAWTPANLRNWKNFSDRMHDKHLPRLNYYGVKYRPIEFGQVVN